MRVALMVCLVFWITACGPVPGRGANGEVVGDTQALLNEIREENGKAALAESPLLLRAAARYARDLSRSGAFSHTGPDGSTPGSRVRAAGYDWCFIAENIAQGQRNEQTVMEDWMKSRGHRRNMLSGRAKEYALVRAEGNYWVLLLGSKSC
ncbi:CAP domain-containing protein [Litoreibacter roseus]|uniref:SCP domain-containing protein n=1 Tax=Litoreibacter roseus TaxID=2601869 RepID=A0A6N6JI58_9RHOB|nr:CAP domain-containing protein [Litoreibacter roseus]GFE65627.1 hypothetical protein KIN_27010 [Litoreibacter roseus]